MADAEGRGGEGRVGKRGVLGWGVRVAEEVARLVVWMWGEDEEEGWGGRGMM